MCRKMLYLLVLTLVLLTGCTSKINFDKNGISEETYNSTLALMERFNSNQFGEKIAEILKDFKNDDSDADEGIDAIEKEIKDTMSMLRHLDISQAIDDIVHAKSVLICSSGMNKYVAKILAVKLSLFGIRTIYPDDSWFLYLEANNLTTQDFVIVISRGGETKDIIDVMKIAKMNGCKMLLISEQIHSSMSKLSDYTMNVSVSKDEGYDIDSRLHMHLAIEYLLRELVNQHLYSKKYL